MIVARILAASFFLSLVGPAIAEVPRKIAPSKLQELCDEWVFSSKPVPPPPPPPPNPVKAYTLAGLSKLEDGWFVVLLHKKDRTKRVRLSPHGFTESGFRVVTVENPNSRHVRVKIATGEQSGWVKFEPEYLVIRRAVPRKNSKVTPKKSAVEKSRVRRVPTPPRPAAKDQESKKER